MSKEFNGITKDKNVLEIINIKYNDFSKTHKKIADYILNNYEKVVFFTSSKLAKECDVSESSIVRFSNAIDYNGFTDFQKDLQKFLREKITVSRRIETISKTDFSEVETLYDVLEKSIKDINWIYNNINEDSFTKIVNLLVNAENIYLVGFRNSFSAISFFGSSLSWIRDNVYVINGIGGNFDQFSKISSNDVLISISLPRYLKQTVKFQKFGYDSGANTVCITDTITSPLVKYSTIPLIIKNEILSFSDNLIPVMCLITGMLNSVARINNKSTTKKVKSLEDFWNTMDLYDNLK